MKSGHHKKIISLWLLVCCALITAMAVIGAITRLTESGLSIVQWHAFKDMLMPLTAAEWERLFALYRQTPEYLQANFGMALNDFKLIYFWEWLHRLWGRLIGLAYALPLLFFWFKGWIPAGYRIKLLFGFLLGGLQGFIGWYMVESGLVDRPDVSHYRLALHLVAALFILVYLWWLRLDLLASASVSPPGYSYSFCKLRHAATGILLLALTIVWGAFTAGLDAGRIYNSWPLMAGRFLPPEAFGSITEIHAWVQFTHRWLAALTLISLFSLAWRLKDIPLAAAVMAQFVLGIFTLISSVWIPLAGLHQFGALATLVLTVSALHRLWQTRHSSRAKKRPLR